MTGTQHVTDTQLGDTRERVLTLTHPADETTGVPGHVYQLVILERPADASAVLHIWVRPADCPDPPADNPVAGHRLVGTRPAWALMRRWLIRGTLANGTDDQILYRSLERIHTKRSTEYATVASVAALAATPTGIPADELRDLLADRMLADEAVTDEGA